ncbi:NAD(P)-dependent oxidoreductase [Paenibacillus sp. P96]|uniref:NAD(P)-dependent oxidoreductase n=1 Tax=Paenibacillus zeirhizosphaerae TaxID=2987519 RepID=A0ABT9FX49_9BACL|nr:NAD(P)-dependent oxidoreductase [Paenibacillus sp. P96]MDP4099270.1 NAD(P)-dependent oxidoreductase [Paenibacillus sp. P96]
MRRKVLITGAAGKVGGCLVDGLRVNGRYDVIAADLRGDAERGITMLDVTDAARLKELTRGVDTVVHCAWMKDEEDFLGKVLPVNVTGAYHLYEAARLNGVRRIVFASSNHATGYYKLDEKVEPTDPYRPDSFYGLSKCYIELLGRLYADTYGVSSFNVRIGNFAGDNRPHSQRAARIWISCRDLVRLVECCIEADDHMKFLPLYGTSANEGNYYDIGYLKPLIGYDPRDNGGVWLHEAEANEHLLKQDESEYQGGSSLNKRQPAEPG